MTGRPLGNFRPPPEGTPEHAAWMKEQDRLRFVRSLNMARQLVDSDSAPSETVWWDEVGRRYRNGEKGRRIYIDPAPAIVGANGKPVGESQPSSILSPAAELHLETLRRFMLDATALDALPPPAPLVEGLLMRNTISVIYGRPGVGKSFLAADLGLSVANGVWWFGRPVHQGPVIYVAAEGSAGLAQRQRAWMEGRRVPRLEDIHWLLRTVNLLSADWVAALVALVAEVRPVLVVIDTLSRSLVGGNENAAEVMTAAVEAADQVRRAGECHVMLVHHAPKDGGTPRGHSALEGAADTIIEVKDDGGVVVLRCEKQKDAEKFEPIRLQRVVVGDSCVLQQGGATVPGERTASEGQLLEVVRHCCGTTGLTSTQLLECAEMPRRTFYRALKVLASDGLVRNVGTEKTPRWAPPDEAPE